MQEEYEDEEEPEGAERLPPGELPGRSSRTDGRFGSVASAGDGDTDRCSSSYTRKPPLAVPDPRIEPAVRDIDEQVDEDESHRHDQDDALDHREVGALGDRADDVDSRSPGIL